MARFGDSGACNVNINCPLGNDWQDEKRGVLKIILTTANGADWCTGSLINNTAQDQRPLLLSANHCLEGFSSSFTDIWGFIFNYEAATCANPDSEPSQEQSIVGATLLARYSFSDFALMELSEAVPADFEPYFNGWDRSDNLPAQTFCIHHPEGDIKKISVDRQVPQRTAYTQGNGSGTSHYRVVWDENTTTEPASSGSPLFTPTGDIVGQLHGGLASCSNLNGADWYGRIAISWEGGGSTGNALKTWLDPLNTGATRLSGRDFNRNDPPPAPTARLLADALEVFPNPAREQIRLRQVNPGFLSQEVVCILYNLQGQKISEWVFDADQLQAPRQAEISLSFLGRGLYWLQFETSQESFGLKLMVE
ncbi:MAG: T9SS type A sorting domain-containing protein [Microscillaceae bacterium]|nr:T9SS type A sorting domain-containing protein [Microscillaceae bacterium]